MGNYKNFKLVVYFIAHGVKNINEQKLEEQIAFFKRYMRLDKVYIEPLRDGCLASEEQLRLCRDIFTRNGIKAQGGITTSMPDPEGAPKKQRLFNVLCYNDDVMMRTLQNVCEMNARVFDGFIIDDFFFTNCTCDKCRAGRDEYNSAHGITDGSWQAYRCDLMYKASQKYVIAPAKAVNPDCSITIKYPNWMESYQETGYDPASQREIFDLIYTGTETRDPVNTDQHLPRYLSYSLMNYMERMAPDRNGGGWFDPYDCRTLEHYLEQAYLTAFAKPKEMMMFCFQSLVDTVNIPALGFMLDKLDDMLTHLGKPVGIPCYIPNASQGEDNIQDFLGMQGFPIITTPDFEKDAPVMLLTASSACDPDIINKLETYIAEGGKAVVTDGFVRETLGRGIERITSIRFRGRSMTANTFVAEHSARDTSWQRGYSSKPITVPVMEFRNNATWGALCKAVCKEEACTMLARDTYGKGAMYTMVLPDTFSDIKYLPKEILDRMRQEFTCNSVWTETSGQLGVFMYDNDTLVIYPYVTDDSCDMDVTLHISGCERIERVSNGREILPLYSVNGEAAFKLRTRAGKFEAYKIVHSDI